MTDTIQPTFTWEFPHWEFWNKPVNGFTGVIKSVNWRLTAKWKGHEKVVFGRFDLEPPEEGAKTFIPKEKLTKDDITKWAEQSKQVDYPGYVKSLAIQLQAMESHLQTVCEAPAFAK